MTTSRRLVLLSRVYSDHICAHSTSRGSRFSDVFSCGSCSLLPSTSLSPPPPPRPFAPRPSPLHTPPIFPSHPVSLHYPSPSYRPATIPSLLFSLHSLLLRMRESGFCPILLDMGFNFLSMCVFLFSLPRPVGSLWGAQCLSSGCVPYF